MSYRAKADLESKLDSTRVKLVAARLFLGEAGGSSDWHDNAALDEAHRQVSLLEIDLSKLTTKLDNPTIVEPRMETEEVGIGNTVSVKLLDFDETLTLNVLGQADAWLYYDSISIGSPLEGALVGKKIGEIVDYKFQERGLRAQVLDILPGQF